MKLSKLTAAVMTVIYTAQVGATAVQSGASIASASNGSAGWQPLQVPIEEIVKRSNKTEQNPNGYSQFNPSQNPSSVNRQLRNLKQAKAKFVPEVDISGEHTYIIQFKDKPVSTYTGGISGYSGTASFSYQPKLNSFTGTASNQKLFIAGKAVNNQISSYQSYLKTGQTNFIEEASKLGVPLQIERSYTVTLNAVSAKLTQAQAQKLTQSDQVEFIQRSKNWKLDTDVGPQHIKADKLWDGSAITSGTQYKGEGQIVGIIDTGINTDHIAFADIGGDGYDHTNPLGEGNYLGQCQEDEFADRCNDKLIGVYTWDKIVEQYSAVYFQPGYPDNLPRYEWQYEEIRPYFGEDYNGHGSHTAGTVAGNVVTDTPVQYPNYEPQGDGRDTGLTVQSSGVAPHANIISYQGCYSGDGLTSPYWGCPTEATLASIEQAVIDGVDVINYSISGWGFPWDDAIQQAWYNAYAAGINVAASAGNGGSGSQTNHPSPWVLSVAATDHGRRFEVEPKYLQTMTGGDTAPPADIEGMGISDEFTGEIVLASNFGEATCDTAFPASTFTASQIVVCERSDQPRFAKADNVLAAGGGAMILYNANSWDQEVADLYSIPTIHIERSEGDEIITWLSTGVGHMGTLSASSNSVVHDTATQDEIASFTSTAFNETFGGSLSPSISAPGVRVLAPYSDDQPFVQYPTTADWAVLDGTSMSSPHVAGALALVRQAHPDWTASEVASAIQLTANSEVLKTTNWSGEQFPDTYFQGGSGLVDLEAAVNTGLIMNETPANMELANPNNGGDPASLNLPHLVNTNCMSSCSWTRTFKATRDGTWDIQVAPQHDAASIEIRTIPNQFSLKAGETATIQVIANILDSSSTVGSPEGYVLWGDVKMVPTDVTIPPVHLPVKMVFGRNNIPVEVNVTAHRDNESHRIKNIPIDPSTDFTARVFKPVKIEKETWTAPQNSNWGNIIFSTGFQWDEASSNIKFIDVPHNAKRLYAKAFENIQSNTERPWNRGNADVYIGIDSNNNGAIDFQDEAICGSYSSEFDNFCNINEPPMGTYWVAFFNPKRSTNLVTDTFNIGVGVVLGNEAENMSAQAATEVTSTTSTVDIDFNWNLENFSSEDSYITSIDLGTNTNDLGNLGIFPVNLTRGVNDIHIEGSQTNSKSGDVIDVSVQVLENTSGIDRDFTLQGTIPEGTMIDEESLAIGNTKYVEASITTDGNTFTITGVQPDSSDWARDYLITTDKTDQMCRMPESANGKYVDLFNEWGIAPQWGGAWNEYLKLTYKDLWPSEDINFLPYNNSENFPQLDFFNISPQGWVSFDDLLPFWPDAYPYPMQSWMYGSRPDSKVTALHRGNLIDGTVRTPLVIPPWWDSETPMTGVSLAYNNDPKAILVDWKGARTSACEWNDVDFACDWRDYGDMYNMQAFFNIDINHNNNQPEVIMAYKDMVLGFGQVPEFLGRDPVIMTEFEGVSGIYGYHGPRGVTGPLNESLGVMYSSTDMDEKFAEDVVVCYDYKGPESSSFDVNFQLEVTPEATGVDGQVKVTSSIDGLENIIATYDITNPSNISVGAINNQTIDEDSTLSDIYVIYNDKDRTSNTISAEGENVEIEISGNDSGSTLSITPIENWHGQTEITVVVSDNQFANDHDSVSFMLTVNSDGILAGCMDENADNYDANAAEVDYVNQCTFTDNTPPSDNKGKKGGSTAPLFIFLTFFVAFALRRREEKKS